MHVSVHLYMYMYVTYGMILGLCVKDKIPVSDGWGLLDQVVGVVVLLGKEVLMGQGTVPRLD